MTKRKLQALLRESAFSPNKLGPLKIISDVGNLSYFIIRAKELVTLAEGSPSPEQMDKYLTQAISLLALARAKINDQKD